MKTMKVIAGVALATLLVSAGTASAERKRVAIPKFEGPQEAAIRGRVAKALKGEGFEPVRAKDVDNAIRDTGGSLDTDDSVRSLAKELSCVAFVTGEISGKKARLTVRNGSDGAVSGEATFTAPNPKKLAAEVGKAFWRRLGSAIERGRVPRGAKAPPKPSAPEPEEEASEGGDDDSGGRSGGEPVSSRDRDRDSDDADSDRPSRRRSRAKANDEEAEADVSAAADEPEETGPRTLPILDIGVGFRGFSRNLTYNQDAQRALRGYKLGMGPAAAVNGTLYLSAFGVKGGLANLGVALDLEIAFGITSQIAANTTFTNGATFPTTIHDFAGGVRYRIPLSQHQIVLSATGGEHAFSFKSGTGAPRGSLDIPDTIYRYLRPGVQARLEVAPTFFVLAGAGYRYVFNSGGQIHDGAGPTNTVIPYFPHLTVAGVDANLGVAYKITPIIEARVIGDLRRYFYSMHSTMADVGTGAVKIAGGAVDQYLSIAGALAFTY